MLFPQSGVEQMLQSKSNKILDVLRWPQYKGQLRMESHYGALDEKHKKYYKNNVSYDYKLHSW